MSAVRQQYRSGDDMTQAVMRQAGATARRVVVIGRNASLGWAQAVGVMLFMSVVTFGIAGIYAALGYWMVLPFAGLEMLALAAGLAWSMRGNDYREVITIDGDKVTVERGLGRPQACFRFNRYWVQLRIADGERPGDHLRLILSESGRDCEVGGCLTEVERTALVQRLRELLRSPVPAALAKRAGAGA